MPESTDQALASRLQSDEDEVRMEALEEVATKPDATYLPYIVASLYHPNAGIRERAAAALRVVKDPRVADVATMALVTERHPDVIFNLILVFLYHPREQVVEVLIPFLDFPDFRIRSAAVDVLGALGGVYGRRDIVEPLYPLLDDARPSVVLVTLRALLHTAESLDDRGALEAIAARTSRLEASPNRMVSELAGTVRRQIEKSLSMLEKG